MLQARTEGHMARLRGARQIENPYTWPGAYKAEAKWEQGWMEANEELKKRELIKEQR